MQNKQLGCLTGTGIISTLIAVLALAGFGFMQGGSMFNAGALNAQQKAGVVLGNVHSHAEIGNDCGACHTAPWDTSTMADRCVTCHTDIATQMKQVATLHGQLANKGTAVLACYDCHPEHRGATASLIDMTGQQFPHDALGFSLKEHERDFNLAPLTCQDCHGSDIKTFDQATCQNCHGQHDASFMQSHVTAYGSNCLGCHTGANRFGEGFNHNNFVFKLDGKHANVRCDQCHAGAQKLADFATVPRDCFSCHKQNDPHAGQFGQDCGTCHTPVDWKQATFDHNLSAFKLTGAHAKVQCSQCHVNNVFKGTPTDCYSCHKQSDRHNGQFGQDCSACHTTTAWDQVTFDHNKSNFPLTGAHATVPCQQCHANGQFKGLSTDCVSCHQDPAWHAGAFGTSCDQCHTTTGWSPAQFNRSHPAIAGGEGGSGIHHGGASCTTCHPSTVSQATCLACHDSNHPGDGGGGGG